MKNWLELHKIKKLQKGNVIPTVIVYGKEKYKEELKKQQGKYLADMNKYSKDSTQWVNANKAYQAYQASLSVYNGSKVQWDIMNNKNVTEWNSRLKRISNDSIKWILH